MALKKLLSTLRPHAIRDGFPASPGQVSITKEDYGYDTNNEPGVAGRTSVEKRRRDDRFRVEATSLLRESIAEIGTRGTGNGVGKYSSGGLTPLEGGPVRGEDTSPDIKLVRIAEQYAAANGIGRSLQFAGIMYFLP
jgi:hypothetical protein